MITARSLRIALGSIAIAAGLIQIAGAGRAQDLAAWYNGVVAQQNGVMNGMVNNIVTANVNDPYVQQMYWQQVQSGMFYGSIEEFAYKFAVTGGMTPEGYGNYMAGRNDNWNTLQTQNNTFMGPSQVYQDAFGRWVQSYGNNQAHMGSQFGGW